MAPTDEAHLRREAVSEQLRAASADALIVATKPNFTYLGG